MPPAMLDALGALRWVVDHRGMAAAPPDPTDETLMLRYAAGESAAFAPLYARHKDGVWRYLLRGSHNEASTAELFQDVWASVVKSRAAYQPTARFATWLYRLAHNRLVDHWRAAKPHDELGETAQELAGHEHETPAARAVQSEQGARLLAALAGLAPEQREAFLLQAEGGLSLEDIATTQGVGRETAKSRLRYALVKLRKELADVWP
ncbi:MAG: sigma-70 family RNA polymerase sigma factor [Pseudomonadota bacterium]